jgi:hypothetical protein
MSTELWPKFDLFLMSDIVGGLFNHRPNPQHYFQERVAIEKGRK